MPNVNFIMHMLAIFFFSGFILTSGLKPETFGNLSTRQFWRELSPRSAFHSVLSTVKSHSLPLEQNHEFNYY